VEPEFEVLAMGSRRVARTGHRLIANPYGNGTATRPKVVTTRWPHVTQSVEAAFNFPS